MESIYKTGNETVDRLGRLRITGNVIPASWYRTIRKETGKPYLNAIIILSDIVYWYRPAEIRDEGSGQLLGYRKRFKADFLQRSYQQIADQFGISRRDATNAIVELEKLGVVRRIFRNLVINGQTVPNVLFLELNVSVLEQLTFPEEWEPEKIEEVDIEKGEKIVGQSAGESVSRGCPRFEGDIPQKQERCITQSSESHHLNERDGIPEMGDTNTEITYKDYHKDYPISSYRKERERFEKQIEYQILRQDLKNQGELEELIDIAVEVLTSTAKTIRVNREEKAVELVKEQYRRLNMFHIQYVLNCLQETETKARNIRAVIVTALYNSVSTIGSYYSNLYQYHNGTMNRGEESG